MVTANDDRRLQLPRCNHFVESQTQAVTITQTDPANTRRKSLELNPFARHIEPAVQVDIIRQQFLDLLIGLSNVLRVT